MLAVATYNESKSLSTRLTLQGTNTCSNTRPPNSHQVLSHFSVPSWPYTESSSCCGPVSSDCTSTLHRIIKTYLQTFHSAPVIRSKDPFIKRDYIARAVQNSKGSDPFERVQSPLNKKNDLGHGEIPGVPKDCLTAKEGEDLCLGARGQDPSQGPRLLRERQLHVTHSVKAGSLGPAGTREVLLVGAGQAVQQPELRFSI